MTNNTVNYKEEYLKSERVSKFGIDISKCQNNKDLIDLLDKVVPSLAAIDYSQLVFIDNYNYVATIYTASAIEEHDMLSLPESTLNVINSGKSVFTEREDGLFAQFPITFVDEELLAVVGYSFKNKKEFIKNEKFIVNINSLVAGYLYFKKIEKEHISSSSKDFLTGLSNRFGLSYRLQELKSKNVNHFLVSMFDIDNFKQINDTYGHLAGDKVLKSFSKVLLENFGQENAFRIGGEEFLVLSFGTKENLKLLLQQLKEKIVNQPVRFEKVHINYSFSCGATDVLTSNNSYDEILHKSDTLLYKSKALGKNTITVE